MSATDPAMPVMPPLAASGFSAEGYPYPAPGLSQWQWFAGLAMQGLIMKGGLLPAEVVRGAAAYATAMCELGNGDE